jgi:hypothetical protein
VTGPCRTSRSEDSEVGHIRLFTGRTTISSVATGPRNREISHHPNPLRPLPWANPAFISDSVPQPIAPLLAFKISLSFESSVGRWSCQRVHGLRGYLSRWSQAEPVRLLEQRPIMPLSCSFQPAEELMRARLVRRGANTPRDAHKHAETRSRCDDLSETAHARTDLIGACLGSRSQMRCETSLPFCSPSMASSSFTRTSTACASRP